MLALQINLHRQDHFSVQPAAKLGCLHPHTLSHLIWSTLICACSFFDFLECYLFLNIVCGLLQLSQLLCWFLNRQLPNLSFLQMQATWCLPCHGLTVWECWVNLEPVLLFFVCISHLHYTRIPIWVWLITRIVVLGFKPYLQSSCTLNSVHTCI